MVHGLRFGGRPVPDGVMRAMFAARKTCLRHAPTLLAASGLDICVGHPATPPAWTSTIKRGSHASAPRHPARAVRLGRRPRYASRRATATGISFGLTQLPGITARRPPRCQPIGSLWRAYRTATGGARRDREKALMDPADPRGCATRPADRRYDIAPSARAGVAAARSPARASAASSALKCRDNGPPGRC